MRQTYRNWTLAPLALMITLLLSACGGESRLEAADGDATVHRGASVNQVDAPDDTPPADAGADPTTAAEGREVALLAGGCFWGMEDLLRDIPGVLETEVGYTGGTTDSATYGEVSSGATGHAESVRIVFDPRTLSYEELLGYYFRMHDPTTPNRQGNDVGTQYRSAIFFNSEAQRESAETVRKRVEGSGKWERPIVTEIAPAGDFWPAEQYHQDYLQKNPDGYTCHYWRD